MFSLNFLRPLPTRTRYYSCNGGNHKVAVVGAGGGIGQSLSLLLKLNPKISELRLHDITNIAGMALELSHIETAVNVSHSSDKDLALALNGGVDICILTAGIPRKPGQSRKDLFVQNAGIVFDTAKAIAKHSPGAILLISTNPVNSVVPVACETLKMEDKLCPSKVIGLCTLSCVRAATLVGKMTCQDPKDLTVPVVGGHSDTTIVPLISRANPKVCVEGEKLTQLIESIRTAGTEVVKAKNGQGSAILSTAYAISRLTFGLLRALNGETNIVESGYVMSDVHPELKYLSTPLILGKNGIEKNLGLGKLSECEQKLFCEAKKILKEDIEMGEKFAREQFCKKSGPTDKPADKPSAKPTDKDKDNPKGK